jgi:BirA family biotin operon repressor/biotin-[acetyl-CoA-carboxylase] ligase
VVQWFATIDSTNRWLLDEARAGAPAGLVAVADHQGAGRGRRGRSWDAAPGSSLLTSILFRPELAPEELHLVTVTTALALADALEATAGVAAGLKWPNDLVVGDRKLAGLLAEAEVVGGHARAVVVGAGVNLGQSSFPGELAATATSCRLETGTIPEREAVLDAMLERLDALLGEPHAAVLDAYRSRLSTLGRDVRIELDRHSFVGRARDVDDHGRLIVDLDDGGSEVVAVGDVVHLRSA